MLFGLGFFFAGAVGELFLVLFGFGIVDGPSFALEFFVVVGVDVLIGFDLTGSDEVDLTEVVGVDVLIGFDLTGCVFFLGSC